MGAALAFCRRPQYSGLVATARPPRPLSGRGSSGLNFPYIPGTRHCRDEPVPTHPLRRGPTMKHAMSLRAAASAVILGALCPVGPSSSYGAPEEKSTDRVFVGYL